MKQSLRVGNGLIGLCLGLFWLGVAALARLALWPDLDAGWVILVGLVVFAFVFWLLDAMQNGLRRWHGWLWQLVKGCFWGLVLVKGIQIVMVAMGAG